MSTKREAAHAAARRGFDVFPIAPNAKTPLIKNWQNLATQDPAQIDAWWDEWPDANLACSTQNLIVVDIDPRNGGRETMGGLLAVETFPTTTVASTQSGGHHFIYAAPRPVKGGTNKLGRGIDIKARGGYILLAGSTIEDRKYAWVGEDPIAPAPQWIIDQCNAAKDRTDTAGKRIIEEDDTARELFEQWMLTRAPTAEYGEIDDTTYKIAARGYDFGCSEATVHEVVSEWNETKCFPPGDIERLAVVVKSAGRNRDKAIGANHPLAPGFEPVEIAERTVPPAERLSTGNLATALRPFTPESLPTRPWVIDGFACRARVTLLAGPGGVAKSTYYLMVAVATATGRADICGFKPVGKERVWVWNQEDDLEEMQRRLLAIMKAFNVTWSDLQDAAGEPMLYLDSGVDKPLMLAKRTEQQSIAAGKQVADVIATAKALRIAVLILDPLVEFHEASENDNVQMRAVLGQVRRIAVEANCAVMLATHTRKPPQASSDGFAGEMDAARGASSQLGVVRIGATIFSMSPKQAKEFGVPKERSLEYVRIDIAKNNLAAVLAEPLWFKREGVVVGAGESVGVLRPVSLTRKAGPVSEIYLPNILAEIIASKLKRGTFLTLATILAKATPAQVSRFSDNKANHTRDLKKAFDGSDEVMTEYGKLTLTVVPKKAATLHLHHLHQALKADEDEEETER